MIKGKRPTREERKYLEKEKLDTFTWLIQKNSPEFLQVVNRETGEERRIDK